MKHIYISDQLHKELKLYAVSHGNAIKNIAENAIGNLIIQKPAAKFTHQDEIKSPMAHAPVKKSLMFE